MLDHHKHCDVRKIPKVLLIIESSREFGRQLLRGIARYSHLHGPWLFYTEPGGLFDKLPKFHKWGVDGVIVRGDALKPEDAVKMGVPVVFAPRVKRTIPGFCAVVVNSTEVGKMGAKHLLERGFKHFGFCGFSDMPWSEMRAKGFSQTVIQAGFEVQLYAQPEAWSVQYRSKEQNLIADWLRTLAKPVGVMTCTDYRGRQVLESCKIAGFHVPEDVAVIGVLNDDIFCELCDPPLSSIVLNVEKGGYEAAAVLDKLMLGDKLVEENVIIQPRHVVIRQSTNILAVEDSTVAHAMRFIRENSKKPIQVVDVVNHTDLSRRQLEQRFRRVLRRSILSEIRRIRVEQICRLLTETDMSVAEIALDLNFCSEKHIARPFRREKGMTPLAYRKKYKAK